MLTTLLLGITGAALLGTPVLSSRDCAALLLTVWTVAVGVFVCSNLTDRFLWIPAVLALAGVFGSTFALAIPGAITLAANAVMLVIFVVSLEMLKKKRRPAIALVRHGA